MSSAPAAPYPADVSGAGAALPGCLRGMGGALARMPDARRLVVRLRNGTVGIRAGRCPRPDSVRRASRARMSAMVFMKGWLRCAEDQPVRWYRCPGEATAR